MLDACSNTLLCIARSLFVLFVRFVVHKKAVVVENIIVVPKLRIRNESNYYGWR